MATATSKTKPAAKTSPASKPAAKSAPSTAVAVRKNTNVVSIQEALKKQAESMGDRVNPASGNKIRITQDKQFVLPDGTKTDSLEVVILDFAAVNNFYEEGYNKDVVKPPGCFSVGSNPKQMVPSDNVPNKQAEDCQSCPMNEFGSDGEGKACKNGRLLAVLPPDATDETPIWLLQLPPTAIKPFDAYVTSVARSFQMPPIACVSTVSFDEGVTYARPLFSDPQPNKALNDMFGRQAEATEMLFAKRDVSGYDKPAAKGGAKAAVRRPANGRR